MDNDSNKFGPKPCRNGYGLLKGNWLKAMKLAIQNLDVHETDFINISKVPQLGVFGIRAARIHVGFAKNLGNQVDASYSRCSLLGSRPAGPLLSFGRVKHTSAGIFLPQSHPELKEVAA